MIDCQAIVAGLVVGSGSAGVDGGAFREGCGDLGDQLLVLGQGFVVVPLLELAGLELLLVLLNSFGRSLKPVYASRLVGRKRRRPIGILRILDTLGDADWVASDLIVCRRMLVPAIRLFRAAATPACLALFMAGARVTTAAEPSASSLEAIARRMLSDGLPNRVPSPIAEALGLEADAPVHNAQISKMQSSDGMSHLLQVLVELSTTTPRRPIRPIGVVMGAYRVSGRRADDYYYRGTLAGTLERAIRIDGEVDEAGNSIKGSGKLISKDIESPEVKKRFNDLGTDPISLDKATPAAHQAHLKAEIDKWAPLIKKAGVYAD